MSDSIERTAVVKASRVRAFEHFVTRLQEWWPAEYTWSGEVLHRIAIEPRRDGPCYEEGPHGFRCDWGRVLTWEPPKRLVFLWQIAPDRTPEPDPAKASEVEVAFADESSGQTRVRLIHRGFSRYGKDSAAYQAGLAAPEGWDYLLKRFAETVE